MSAIMAVVDIAYGMWYLPWWLITRGVEDVQGSFTIVAAGKADPRQSRQSARK
ncbi:hypothetical protein B0A49_05818, partial [Cryomyces minteri]